MCLCWGRVSRGLYLEGLVGTEHWSDLVSTVGAPYPAELTHQSLACLTVVSHLFLVIWTHQTLGVQRTVKQLVVSVRVLTYQQLVTLLQH